MPKRANEKSCLVLVLQVDETTSWPASRCRANRSPQRLVSIPLLILVAAALTTIHSESLQLQKFPSFSLLPNQIQYTSYDSPPPASGKIQPTISPASSVYNSFSSNNTQEIASDKIADETEGSTYTDINSEEHFVSSRNNNSNHAILVRENTHQQQHQQGFNLPKAQIQQNSADKYSTRSTLRAAERANQGSDQMQNQYVVSEFNEKPIIAETNFENGDLQSRKSNFSSFVDEKQAHMRIDAFNQAENMKSNSKDLDDNDHKVLGKRFGFFKKGQQSNNNLPNLGAISFYDDCDRCLHNAGLGSTQTASWMLDSLSPPNRQHQQLSQTPQLVYPVVNLNAQSYMHPSGQFKSKFNKFLLQKSRNIGYYNFPKSYLYNYKYKPSMSGRTAFRTPLSQPLSCIQPANLAGLGPLMNQASLEHIQLGNTKISPQTSYSNFMY